MIVFTLLIILVIWCCLVLYAEKKHYQKHYDQFLEEDKPIKFSDTMKEYHKLKNIKNG